jgi:hypothetical protein
MPELKIQVSEEQKTQLEQILKLNLKNTFMGNSPKINIIPTLEICVGSFCEKFTIEEAYERFFN